MPTMYDLPSEDPEEPGLPDIFHGLQPQMLDETLWLPSYPDGQFFSAFNLNVYYDVNHTDWHHRPDWFLVLDVPRLYRGLTMRRSYVVWDEPAMPIVVMEFLVKGLDTEELGQFSLQARSPELDQPPTKFVVYEEILKIPNYIVFDEETQRLRFFRLVDERYQEQTIEPNNPRLWIPELNLGLGLTICSVRRVEGSWLRWCDQEGNFYPTPAESYQAEAEAAKAEAEAAKAETVATIAQMEQQQQQAIVNFLRLGLSPEQISIALGVEISKVEALRNL
jgi:Uma2 family endonuclease